MNLVEFYIRFPVRTGFVNVTFKIPEDLIRDAARDGVAASAIIKTAIGAAIPSAPDEDQIRFQKMLENGQPDVNP